MLNNVPKEGMVINGRAGYFSEQKGTTECDGSGGSKKRLREDYSLSLLQEVVFVEECWSTLPLR